MATYKHPNAHAITDLEQAGVVPQNAYYESLVTINATQDQITRGVGFFTNYHWAAGLNVVQDIVAITPATSLIISLEDEIVSTLETEMSVYIGTTFTDNGTVIPVTNRNGLSANTAVVDVYHTPTIDALGALVYTTRWGTGSKSGAIRDGFPAILNPSQTYMFRITSRAAGNNITHELHTTEDIQRN